MRTTAPPVSGVPGPRQTPRFSTAWGLLVLWQAAAVAGLVDRYTVPLPTEIIAALPRLVGEEHVAARFGVTEGGGQTQQAVISGSVDIGIGVATFGVLGAFGKGAPVRIIGNSMDGAHDLCWYVRADSPIRSPADAAGRTVGYSTTGSSTDLVVRGLQRVFDVTVRPVATGSPPSTFTQVMSGQVDIGWASPPFGVEAVEAGRTRIVARGSDVPAFAEQSVRVMIANAGALSRKADAIARYMRAYRETLDWMYSDPAALEAYGKWAGGTSTRTGSSACKRCRPTRWRSSSSRRRCGRTSSRAWCSGPARRPDPARSRPLDAPPEAARAGVRKERA